MIVIVQLSIFMSSFEKYMNNMKGTVIEKLLLVPLPNSLGYSLYSSSIIKCFQFHGINLYTLGGQATKSEPW